MDIRQTLTKSIFYHGSLDVVAVPSVEKCSPFSDFGKGFYITQNQWQAKEWGKKRAFSARVNDFAVNMYSFKNISGLRIRIFNEANECWLNALLKGRAGQKLPFDIVIGPVADGDIARTLMQYEQALALYEQNKNEQQLKEKALEIIDALNVHKTMDQFALLSEKATEKLFFEGAYIYNKWGSSLIKEIPAEKRKVVKPKLREF